MKRLLKIIVGIVALLILMAVALLFWLDPNVFKPRIQALAEKQGVHLSMEGDLSWRFWPSVGIELNKIAVASINNPDEPVAKLQSASLMVATAPLFSGELVVESLLINGAELDLTVNEAGAGNWQALTAREKAAIQDSAAAQEVLQRQAAEADSTPAAPAEAGEAGRIKLAIDVIEVSNAQLNYQDARTGTELALGIDALSLLGFNFENRPFELNLQSVVALTDPVSFPRGPVQLALNLQASMTVDQAMNQFELTSSELNADITSGAGNADLTVNFDMTAQDLQGDLTYQGKLTVKPLDVKAVLASLGQTVPSTANPDAMSAVGFTAEVAGGLQSAALNNVMITLDDTTFTGTLAITDIPSQAIELALAGDKINVDHYLPPVSEESPNESEASTADSGEPAADSDATATGNQTASVPEEPLPLETLRNLNVMADLSLQEVIVNQLTMTNVQLTARAKDGLLELQDASLNTYQGRLESTATLDARGEQARVNFDADLAGVEMAPLLRDLQLDESVQLTGALNFDASGSTQGVYASELVERLSADANFAGDDVVFAPINVEEYFCKAVALANDEKESEDGQTGEERQWPDKTLMRALEGKVTIRDQIVQVENFSAGVQHLIVSTLGSLNLGKQQYDFSLPMTLLEESTSEMGCTVKSNYWLNRSLSLLRCKGSLANVSPLKDCGLDSKALESLVGDYAKHRLQKELIRQLAGDDEDGDGDGNKEQSDTEKAVEGLLKGLFKNNE
ncbi:AsmA family protein [Gilvimarinus agarilyticus]|uniref:AsmA family protein n=1 Tax=Gilvimarinus sp. 2_MG-2023 TaxID=3062666 RepID=UPI001C0A3632|nr:AsmA family protein [Gilvimarinus sp. 2_MG-2023]MBU2886569.1 AsmA family protein [Gilvimarinus agarilyticus]MDO6571237.1 AsmA family protein [Gilvimarinus sp. 2_MG-2023]